MYDNLALCLLGGNDGVTKSDNFSENFRQKLEYLDYKIETSSDASFLFVTSSEGHVATGGTLEQDLLQFIGLTNAAADYSNWIVPEADLATLNPDIIFVASPMTAEDVTASPLYASLDAVLAGRIIEVDSKLFELQSPAVFDTLYSTAKQIYPENFGLDTQSILELTAPEPPADDEADDTEPSE